MAAVSFGDQFRNIKPKAEVACVFATSHGDHGIEHLRTHAVRQWWSGVGYRYLVHAVDAGQIAARSRRQLAAEIDGIVDKLVEHLNQELRRACGLRLVNIARELEGSFPVDVPIGRGQSTRALRAGRTCSGSACDINSSTRLASLIALKIRRNLSAPSRALSV